MSAPQPAGILERLAPEVVAYERRPFALRHDLERLDRVRQIDAHEAAALYCGRIVEALAPAAVRQVGLDEVREVYNNLETLNQYNFLGLPFNYWAHGLRRLANDARHLRRPISPGDTDTALLLLERWLHWFFCKFDGRAPKLAHLASDGQPLAWAGFQELMPVVQALEADTLRTEDVVALARTEVRRPAFLRTPTLAAALAEELIRRNQYADALPVLTAALRQNQTDLRLRQLHGLYHSRTGNLDLALRVLKKLDRDDETVGIKAGVYKRLWEKRSTDRQLLDLCHKTYHDGWKRSQKSNTYLGINSAATALWRGHHPMAGEVAKKVAEVLRKRLDFLTNRGETLGYWDLATLAEAQLIQGDVDTAFVTYHDAFTRYPDQQGDHKVTRDQALKILKALGRGAEAARLP
jgi:tetratricopeptide (TPR) repeat protein